MNYDLSLIFPALPIFASLVSFGVGLFVFLRNPRHPVNIGFGLGMLSLVLIETGGAIFLLSDSEPWALFGRRVSLIGEATLPSAWLLFSITFARVNYKEIMSRWRPILIGLYSVSIFFIAWIKSHSFFFLPSDSDNYEIFMLGPIGRYFYIFLIVGIIINLIHLENTLRSSGGIKRQQIKNVIIGVGAILSFHIYLASKVLLFSIIDATYLPVASVILLISCSMVFSTVVRNRLLDIDIFISRYVIYNSMTVLLVGAYLLIVGLIAQGIKLAGGSFDTFWSTLFTFAAIVGIVASFFSTKLRRKIQLFITRHFYKHKYEFRDKWMETTEKIGAKSEISQIQKTIVEMISETMGAQEVYLWLYEPAYREYHLVTSTVSTAGQIRLKEDHPIISYIKKYNTPFLINSEIQEDKGRENVAPAFMAGKRHGWWGASPHATVCNDREPILSNEIVPLIAATKAVLCTPLIVGGGDFIGFILQGEDISGEPYKKDDLDLLKAIASHAANRIKTIRLTQELLAAKETETFQQVSSFFIHDLKNLVSTLSLLVQNTEEHMSNPLFQQDAARTLRSAVSKMNAMISNLTILYKGLRVSPSPMNLNDLLEETLSALNGQVSARIVRHMEDLPVVPLDGEQLRKVCLNLLLNAIEASSPAGKIEVRTFAEDGDVVLIIADHGCGMSREFIQSSLFRPFQTTKPHGLGIGLFQCKKIVEAHKGRIEVESEEGNGSTFRVVLPVK